jgi:hypothetical protein
MLIVDHFLNALGIRHKIVNWTAETTHLEDMISIMMETFSYCFLTYINHASAAVPVDIKVEKKDCRGSSQGFPGYKIAIELIK